MLKALTLFLIFQLIGETLAQALRIPIPGPVVGMAMMLMVLLIRYRETETSKTLPDWLPKTADGLLQHLSLLFVPASVGLVQHLDRLETEWLAITLALMASTLSAIAIGALTFVLVARWTDHRATGDEIKADKGGIS